MKVQTILFVHLLNVAFCNNERHKRQTAVTTPICLNPGIPCITGQQGSTGSPPIQIDPRIVVPGQTLPSGQCTAGQYVCNQVSGGPRCGQRYVNPVSTTDGTSTYGAYPWQAYVMNQTGYTGSGVLIDNYHVITAAHKVYLNQNTPNFVTIMMSIWDPVVNTTTARLRQVQTIVVNTGFNPNTLVNDIAILRLTEPVPLGYILNVGYACLPTQGSSYLGQSCYVSGYGKSAFTNNDSPSVQKQVTVTIVDYTTCRAGLVNVVPNIDTYLDPNGQLCAGGQANRDACTQDGGAPLVCPTANGFTVVGIVIWGKGCGQPGVYGVYTDITKYVGWIQQTVTNLNMG